MDDNFAEKNIIYLCCPECRSDLIEQNNFLICKRCGEKYNIQNGIPVLVNLKNLSIHLHKQVKYFDNVIQKRIEYKLYGWQRSYVVRFVENFDNIMGKTIIDSGTGYGYMAIELAKLGARVIALDITFNNLVKLKQVAEELNIKNIHYICCNAEKLPFRNGFADFFISNACLEHIANEKKAIGEINRICKNSAGLMITVPLKFKYLNPLFIPIHFLLDKRIGHLRRYDKEDLIDRFYTWKLVRIYYTGHFKKTLFAIFKIVKLNLFDEHKIEKLDDIKSGKKYWASNICAIFKR